jgi:hypothetical protein
MIMSRDDRWFVTRVTLIVGGSFSLLFAAAQVYGGKAENWLFLLGAIFITFLLSTIFAFGTWIFLVYPKRYVEDRAHERSATGGEPQIGNAMEYAAHFSEADTRQAERAFVQRGLRKKLWLRQTLIGPLSAAIGAGIVYAVGAATWLLVAFVTVGCLLLILSAALLIARPALAVAYVRRHPVQVIAFRPQGLVIRSDPDEHLYAWWRIHHIWDFGPHYVLVADGRSGIHLPKKGLPEGALEYIHHHAALSDNEL